MSLDLEFEPPHCVGLVGASTRAAAFSALRAGLTPFCWDLFADTDLAAVADVEKLSRLTDDAMLDSPARRGLPLMQVGALRITRSGWRGRPPPGRSGATVRRSSGESGILWISTRR